VKDAGQRANGVKVIERRIHLRCIALEKEATIRDRSSDGLPRRAVSAIGLPASFGIAAFVVSLIAHRARTAFSRSGSLTGTATSGPGETFDSAPR
jgi:hypothetical protein